MTASLHRKCSLWARRRPPRTAADRHRKSLNWTARKLTLADGGLPDVLPYFLKSEDQQRGESELHGVGGPLSVSDQISPNQQHHDVERRNRHPRSQPSCPQPETTDSSHFTQARSNLNQLSGCPACHPCAPILVLRTRVERTSFVAKFPSENLFSRSSKHLISTICLEQVL